MNSCKEGSLEILVRRTFQKCEGEVVEVSVGVVAGGIQRVNLC